MELDLTGIVNENAFYSEHYLHSVLEKDLRQWVKAQREEIEGDALPPWNALQKLKEQFLELHERFQLSTDSKERLALQRTFVRKVVWALGFTTRPATNPMRNGPLPVFAVEESDPNARLWMVEAFDSEDSGEDVLLLPAHALQLDEFTSSVPVSLDRLIGDAFFAQEPPRWILVVSLRTFVLLDRSKWSGHRALRFDWEGLYNRKTLLGTFQMITMLLSRSSLCPDSGQRSVLDLLDEQSRAHAQSISGGLKFALREAVELLGDSCLRYLRRNGRQAEIDALDTDQLTVECLRYMYRLLFLFTVEARPELGYLPMNARVYREGYSLEQLRNLELASLLENGSAAGYFFHYSLTMLFSLIFEGYDTRHQRVMGPGVDTFTIAPLKSSLFDPELTPLLSSVKIDNETWQRIIRMMSLGHEDYPSSQRGRISYAQLGVNHLGAVYEALLSYRGFIAKEDLYEVKRNGTTPTALDPAYFVNSTDLEDYDQDERVYDAEGRLVYYPRGSFVYRLTGRAREESASYYTPESLTQCVVEYALKEVIKGKSADELLKITICEPAMGSAAFLNEAVSQLAAVYLKRKLQERNETLTTEKFADELQRVKMYLADNNVYGVDLNPVAVDLGAVSLWLNTLVKKGFVPWFGNQLKCGNSLVGAWSRVYHRNDLTQGKWWTQPPEETKLAALLPEDTVYHFLLGDPGMALYKDKAVKGIAPEHLKRITDWRKAFTTKCSVHEVPQLVQLSRQAYALWHQHAATLRRLEQVTTDPFAIYPAESDDNAASTTTREKDAKLNQILHLQQGHNANAYRRLKLVMDYWCALWFWPIEQSELLPTRQEYLSDISLLLTGKAEPVPGQLLEDTPERDALGFVDILKLTEERPRLQVAEQVADRYRFHHWELEYADQFIDHGGFSVVLGNPPWLKVGWTEKHVMADTDPRVGIRKHSATAVNALRPEWLELGGNRSTYLKEYEAPAGLQNFLHSAQNYPLLKGLKTNLYKAFLNAAWNLQTEATGLLHPNSVFDEAKGALLRSATYPRLRYHFRFTNALKLFSEIDSRVNFSVNIYGKSQHSPTFVSLFNLVHPVTVQQSFEHDGSGTPPGIKDKRNRWELAGHKRRLIPTGLQDLALYAELFDAEGTPAMAARLAAIHTTDAQQVLRKLADMPHRLRDLEGDYFFSSMWHESGAQKAGIIRRETRFPEAPEEWIFSGPHFFVGTPLFKTPNAGCKTNADYSRLDLTTLPADYRPRTNYVPGLPAQEYRHEIPRTSWDTLVTAHYRLGFRRMVNATNERTLIAAVIPRGAGHIHPVVTLSFRDVQTLLQVLQGTVSIVIDYVSKVSDRSEVSITTLSTLPIAPYDSRASARIRGLTCLTEDYAELWNASLIPTPDLGWGKMDHRLDPGWFYLQGMPWERRSALRTDYARRQALIELDVLFAQAAGITLQELCAIYREQFPVLQSYENDTWYDRQGRIIFSAKKGEGGLPRKLRPKDTCYGIRTPTRNESNIALGWEDVRNMKEGHVTWTFEDTTLSDEPVKRTITYQAPFDRCDREEDYAQAWEHFEKKQ